MNVDLEEGVCSNRPLIGGSGSRVMSRELLKAQGDNSMRRRSQPFLGAIS